MVRYTSEPCSQPPWLDQKWGGSVSGWEKLAEGGSACGFQVTPPSWVTKKTGVTPAVPPVIHPVLGSMKTAPFLSYEKGITPAAPDVDDPSKLVSETSDHCVPPSTVRYTAIPEEPRPAPSKTESQPSSRSTKSRVPPSKRGTENVPSLDQVAPPSWVLQAVRSADGAPGCRSSTGCR